ncbi:hypothetical protein CDV55_104492 [Aspergillus turcosus]|uniref:Uncharacterized protein n=1 Tax=Aspergillus turcosus TaxID=1245748 RepID=A0A397H1P6_9EURO|nr:hypothetical protein CDV55_104492 [Aspergillus turcosus]RLL96224.1 hypothetical protein CFD26_106087 [Aspergillus turcosus]
MAAIALRNSQIHHLAKRHNWASENPGVILVFCIVFIVGVGVIALFAYRKWMARKARMASYEVEETK